MVESLAITEYEKLLRQGRVKNTFMEWLKESQIKIVNLPTSHQFWLRNIPVTKN